MKTPDESLLTESAWHRATRDTWPPGWWKKLGKRALVAGIVLVTSLLFRNPDDRDGLVQSAIVGVVAFIAADAVLYPMNVLLSPKRQRDELRGWALAEMSKASKKIGIRAAVIRGRGDTNLIDVSNPGDVTVRDIKVSIPASHCIQSVGWKEGDIVIAELRPGEKGSVPFMLSRGIGRGTESVRAELRGRAGEGDAEVEVTTTAVIDPHRL